MGLEGLVWFLGQVEDTNDPLKLGRVRVRFFGDNNQEIGTAELKWATPLSDITAASLAGVGRSPTGLLVGSHVMGVFLDGRERQKPVVLGSIAKIPEMDQSRHDVNSLARGEQILEKDRVGPEPASPYRAQYPYNQVTATQSGHVIEVDDTPGAERIHIYHKSGSYEEVGPNGQRVTKTKGNNYEIVAGDDTIHITGKAKITVEGNCEINVGGSCNIKARTANLEATGRVTIKGTRVDIN